MIGYTTAAARMPVTSYDTVYAGDPEHFKHGLAQRVLPEVIKTCRGADGSLRFLEVGCGQGQLVAKARDLCADAQANERSTFAGIDGSVVAVRQCDARWPDCVWFHDTIQRFLAEGARAHFGELRFDLVLNHAGLTSVASEIEYASILGWIRDLLEPTGYYLVIISRTFQVKWESKRTWRRSIFDIGSSVFGTEQTIPHAGYHIVAYGR